MWTDRQVASYRPPKDGRRVVREPGRTGIELRISADGTPEGLKVFSWMYRYNGKQKRLTIGRYPDVGLADAHAAVIEGRRKLKQGIDPGAEIAQARDEEMSAPTLRDFADTFIEKKTGQIKPDGIKEIRRVLDRDVLPHIGDRKVRDIETADLTRVLDRISDRGSTIMRNRADTVIKGMFKLARQRGLRRDNPTGDLERYRERPRDRVLSPQEIHNLWHGLDNIGIGNSMVLAIRLMLVCGQRRGETMGMTRQEINGDLWTLPASRTKNGKKNLAPLTPFARGLIDEALRGSNSMFVFPAPRGDQPLMGRSVAPVFSRHRAALGIDAKPDDDGEMMPPATPHDLRRTAATCMKKIGIESELVGAILNHTGTTVTSRVYVHDDMVGFKRDALEQYHEWLQFVIAGNFQAAQAMRDEATSRARKRRLALVS